MPFLSEIFEAIKGKFHPKSYLILMGASVILAFTVNRLNADELKDTHRLAQDLGVDVLRINAFIPGETLLPITDFFEVHQHNCHVA